MKVTSNSFTHGGAIPGRLAFAVHDPATRMTLSANRNPHLAWTDAPAGTRSFAIVCVDPDVPSRGDDVNKQGRTVPADLPRVNFYHWVLADIPVALTEIAEGTHSDGVVPRGKAGPECGSLRHGRNSYAGLFTGDPEMGGDYFGYDGPCPPWNDSIVHHYHFIVYALDTERAPIEGAFDGAAFQAAIGGHILGEASIVGTYSLNPDVGLSHE